MSGYMNHLQQKDGWLLFFFGTAIKFLAEPSNNLYHT